MVETSISQILLPRKTNTKKVNLRCIKKDFNIARKIGEVLLEYDYCRWEAIWLSSCVLKIFRSEFIFIRNRRTSNSIGLMSSFLANRIRIINWIGSCNWNGLSRYKKNIWFERIILDYILGVVKRNPLLFHSISCKNNGFLFTTPNIYPISWICLDW